MPLVPSSDKAPRCEDLRDLPGGMGPRVCSDECVNDTDCMTGQTCSATTRRCG